MFKSVFKIKKEKCKILYISPGLESGGAENILYNVVISQNREDIVLISMTTIGYYGYQLRQRGYRVIALNMKKNILIFFKFLKLIFFISKLKPQIVHTWLYHGNLIGGIIAKILRVKKIYWSVHHDFEYSNILTMLEMQILRILSYLIPEKIIFCSSSSKNNHLKNGYKKSCSLLIRNGVSFKKFKPNKKYRKETRENLNIENNCLVLGNISRFHPLKDHDNLFKSLSIIKEKNIDFICIIAGIGLSKENKLLKNKIYKYKVQDKVKLIGKCNEIFKIVNAFDLNVLTSKKESFPVNLLEAMASGVPCLSTDVGDAINIIGNTGWVVDSENPLALAKCIEKISKNKHLLKDRSLMARQRIIDNFSLEIMNEDYRKLYC